MSLVTLKPGLTVAEAAERAGVATKTIRQWIDDNKLDALNVADQLFFIPEDALICCLERRAARSHSLEAW